MLCRDLAKGLNHFEPFFSKRNASGAGTLNNKKPYLRIPLHVMWYSGTFPDFLGSMCDPFPSVTREMFNTDASLETVPSIYLMG